MDDVLRFLLDKIALCGNSGTYPSEVFNFLKSYTEPWDAQLAAAGDCFPGVGIATTSRALLNSVTHPEIWSWLIRHPGLFVGKEGEASNLSLEEVNTHNERVIATCRTQHENNNEPGTEADAHSLHCLVSASSPILKVYATEEHIWHAIAGHGADSSRIPPKDFDCLCVIAQHGEAGIDQPTLVKLTGQDNRSVPMRTQRLCDAGYVSKVPTTAHGARTSLLILKRFSSSTQRTLEEVAEAADEQPDPVSSTRARPSRSKHAKNEPTVQEALTNIAETQSVSDQPRWDPSRQLTHIIRDVVDAAGNEGITLQGIKESATGIIYDRPVDHVLGRLVDFQGVSQPPHLKHLGVIRDVMAVGKANVYVHYAGHRLGSLLRSEKISKDAGFVDSVDATDLDGFGFPTLDETKFKAQAQAKSLTLCASVPKQRKIKETRVQLEGGVIKVKRPRGRPRKNAQVPSTTQRTPITGQTITLERPRETRGESSEADIGESITVVPRSKASKAYRVRQNARKPTEKDETPIENTNALTYHEQHMRIQRPSTGIFVGQLCELRRPGLRGRRPKSRLAVIKTPKLAELSWFTESPSRQFESSRIKGLKRAFQDSEAVFQGVDDTTRAKKALKPSRKESYEMQPWIESSAISSSDNTRNDDTINAHPPQPLHVTKQSSIAKNMRDTHVAEKESPGGSRVIVGRGSVAAKRRQVILDIVETAGGLYPGGNELWYPFTTLWQQSHPGIQPDGKTIKRTVSTLLENGKLRRVTFNFKNRFGLVIVKSILTLPDIEPDDERVKKIQEEMIAADPRYHLPEDVPISSELRPSIKKPDKPTNGVTVEEKTMDLSHEPVSLRKRKAAQAETEDTLRPRKAVRQSTNGESASLDADGDPTLSLANAREEYSGSEDGDSASQPYTTYQPPSHGIAFDIPNHQPHPTPAALSKRMISEKRANGSSPQAYRKSVGVATENQPQTAQLGPRIVKTRTPPKHDPKPRRLTSEMNKPHSPLPLPAENKEVLRRNRARGSQIADLNDEWHMRIYIATLLVKVLVGGLDQAIDYELVASALGNQITVAKLKTKWNFVRASFKHAGIELQDRLRETIARGFEEGSLAPPNYDDIKNYDWKGLVDWTVPRVGQPKSSDRLPESRAILDKRFKITTTQVPTLVSFYEDSVVTLQQRRYALHRYAYAEDLTPTPSEGTESERLVLSRSWVHATMITPQTDYDAQAAAAKLAFFTEDELSATVRLLRAEKMISIENKGRLFPGRGYDFSEKYTSQLKSNIESNQLRDAAKFKRALDSEFAESRESDFDPNAPDGAYLALVNMISHGQLRTDHSATLPQSSYLVEIGYQTRKMDKSRLIFTFRVEPTAQFREGNPLDLSIEPPRCEARFLGSGQDRVDITKIPMWYDMNGNVVPIMWEVARAVVALQLNTRPGITVQRLADAVKPLLQPFEIELILQWLVDVGAAAYVDKPGSLVRLGEWWWMVLGDVTK